MGVYFFHLSVDEIHAPFFAPSGMLITEMKSRFYEKPRPKAAFAET